MIICSCNGLGCSGQIAISLTWQRPQQLHPHILVHLDLNPLQLQLHPHHLPLLSKVAECLNQSSQQAQHAQHDRPDLAGSSAAEQREAGFVAGARSYVESALLPNCERLAQDVVGALSWNSSANPIPANSVTEHAGTAQRLPADDAGFWSLNSNLHSTAYLDAHSMMDSVGTTFNSFLSTTAASLGSSQHAYSSSFSSPQQQGQPQRNSSQGKVHTANSGRTPSLAENLQVAYCYAVQLLLLACWDTQTAKKMLKNLNSWINWCCMACPMLPKTKLNLAGATGETCKLSFADA